MNIDSILFIGGFLPVILLLHTVIPGLRGKNWLLLAAGLVFYSFGSLQGLLLLLIAALVNYLLGLRAEKKWARTAGIVLNLAFLGAYKYLNFLLGEVLHLPGTELELIAPIGISFFTFRAMSYLIDVSRSVETKCRSFPDFLLYLSFFPQVMAGPIMRYDRFAAQLRSREVSQVRTAQGLCRFTVGLSKKLLLSSTLGAVADGVFSVPTLTDARLAWLGAAAYMLQIYFDFSGYSDMAIGLSGVFGFDTEENFLYPYTARTLGDFCRRWHISLSSGFRDYVYIPLGGNRKGMLRAGLNKLVVFALCGVWHGASWTFLVWGLWHGLLSALESINVIPAKRLQKTKVLGRLYTLFAVCLGFVMFRAGSVEQGLAVIKAMFTGFAFTLESTVTLYTLLNAETVLTLAVGAAAAVPVLPRLKALKEEKPAWEAVQYALVTVLLVLSLIKLASTGFTPFIYAQF